MKSFLAGTALCLSLAASPVYAQEFSNLVIFGDSLSDTGNIAKIVPAAVLATIPPGTPGVPLPPYYDFRFSNGPIYADTLGARLGIANSADFAIGGAFSAPLNETIGAVSVTGTNVSPLLEGFGVNTSIQGQITSYLGSGATVSPHGLYVVWGGANDYFGVGNALLAQPTLSPAQVTGIAAQAIMTTVGNLTNDVGLLAKAGGHNFVVPTLPNLGATPYLNGSPVTAQLGQILTATHNTLLASSMGQLGRQMHVNIYLVDTAGLFNDVLANPSKYGVSNTTNACLTAAGVCANPSSYLFWDDVHPTSGISQIFGQAVTATVQAPLVIGAQAQIADIVTQQIFDALSARVNALRQGASGVALSTPGMTSIQSDSTGPFSVYASSSYGQGDRDTRSTETGFDYTHTSFQLGADARVNSKAAIGAQLGFGTTGADLRQGMGKDDLRTYSLAIYGGLLGEHWYASAAGFYAYQDWDKLNRNTYVANQVASASTTGSDAGAKLEGGYLFHQGNLAYGPMADIRYARTMIAGYSEQGAVALNEMVENQAFDSIVSQLGGQVAAVYEASGMVFKPTLHASWDHQYEGTRNVYSALASLPQASLDTLLPANARNWARVGLGLNVEATRALTVVFDADGTLGRGDGKDVNGMIRLNYQL